MAEVNLHYSTMSIRYLFEPSQIGRRLHVPQDLRRQILTMVLLGYCLRPSYLPGCLRSRDRFSV